MHELEVSLLLTIPGSCQGSRKWEVRGQFNTYQKMGSFQKQHCWCYRDLDGCCNKELQPAVALLDLESPGRKVIDVAGGGCGWEYEETDNGWMEPVVVPETDGANQVDAAESRLSEDAANAAVAVVSLAVRDGDDAGNDTSANEMEKII